MVLITQIQKFIQWTFQTPKFSVDIFMKSGNVVHLHNLKSFKYNYDGEKTKISWEFHSGRTQQILRLDVEQVEGIVSTQTWI